MNATFLILFMMFCHIVADYNLQGWLASAKQKKYWEDNAPEKMYKNDYIMALIMHSIGWTFMIMLPIAIMHKFIADFVFYVAFLVNTALHIIVDDLKANKHAINLWVDQLIHIGQIIVTAIIFLIL